MNWLEQEGNAFSDLLKLRPALQKKYVAFLQAIEENDRVGPRIFSLCRARIEQIHLGSSDYLKAVEAEALNQGILDQFSEDEQAALRVAGRIPYQYHQLEDDEVAALKTAFGDAGCVSLLTALAFFDVSCRLNLTFGKEQN
jgi:hypothetical protein